MEEKLNYQSLKKRLDGISISFNSNTIFENCSIIMDLNVHNIVLISGENGSGKTTLLRVLSGIYYNKGIEFTDGDLLEFSYQNIYYLPSGNSCLFFRNTVKDNICYFYKLFTRKNLDYNQICDSFGELSEIEDKLVVTLSSGQKKYVELIIAFLIEKPILLLDEPFTFLSKRNKEIVLKMMNEYEGKIVLISHDLELEELSRVITKEIKPVQISVEARGEHYDFN